MNRYRGIFFDMHGVLVDLKALYPQYAQVQARMLQAKFGGSEGRWLEAYKRNMNWWNTLWLKGEFKGEEGVERMWQASRQMVEAILDFLELTVDERDKEWMLHQLPYEVGRRCQVCYPEVSPCLSSLAQVGLVLSVTSLAMSPYNRGLLEGSSIAGYFSHIFGPDTIGLGHKGEEYYRRAFAQVGMKAQECVILDDNIGGIQAAKSLGALAVLVDREGTELSPDKEKARSLADLILPDLRSLPPKLGLRENL